MCDRTPLRIIVFYFSAQDLSRVIENQAINSSNLLFSRPLSRLVDYEFEQPSYWWYENSYKAKGHCKVDNKSL